MGCFRCDANLLHQDYHVTKLGQTLCDHCYRDELTKSLNVIVKDEPPTSEAWSVEDILSREG
jgi:hypothetical protein